MSQASFAHLDAGTEPARSAGVYSARPATTALIREAADAAGFFLIDYDLLAELDDAPPALPSDVLLIDCPVQDGATLAALAQLDQRAALTGNILIVSTTISALDSVFGCLNQSNPIVLVEPNKGERVIALTIALTKVTPMRVRDLSEDDKLTIHHLSEQVAKIMSQLNSFADGRQSAFRLESPSNDFDNAGAGERRLIRPPRSPLPDPRLVRLIIRQRQLRGQFFDPQLFGDPAWDILLDLTAARAEHTRVSVTSLCIASGVPPTTALRWIGQMVETGLLDRVEDESDRRRAFIQLSDKAAEAMARYFAELGKDAKSLV